MSIGFGKNSSSTKTKPVAWKWQKQGLKGLGGQFSGLIGKYGFETALSQPLGILNSVYQNLFGENPAGDYLGARQALERVLAPNALKEYTGEAMSALMPWMKRESDIMREELLGRMGHTGTRFSTDFGNILNRGQQDLALRTQQQALSAAIPYMQTQLTGARGVYDMIGSLAERQIARQIPLYLQLLTAYAPTGSFGQSSGWNFNAGLGNASNTVAKAVFPTQ